MNTPSGSEAHDAGGDRSTTSTWRRRTLFAALTVLLTSALILLAAEVFVNRVVAGKIDLLSDKLRKPGAYATYHSDDDYWKLYRRFSKEEPPGKTHPVLGWVNKVDHETYEHHDVERVQGRTPVLLYGDSFAECVIDECFEDILNDDPELSRTHYLLNHGVGGYGVDQIALLYERTIGLYEDPFVVFSLMILDLDRSVLSYRSMQKPYFVIKDGSLELAGVPIDPDQAKYLDENPPRVRSYLWRLFSHSRILPPRLRGVLTERQKKIEHKKKLNRLILERVIRDFRTRNLSFVFLVFQPHLKHKPLSGPGTWREKFLKDFLEHQGVPYIWAKSVIRKDAARNKRRLSEYFFAGDNHPTELCNRLIADEIKSVVNAP